MLKSFYHKEKLEAGCDEAGRGCLAGPVFAAAVILPKTYKNKVLRDSKKLTENQRELLFEEIKSVAVSYSIKKVTEKTIDKINILNASIKAMNQAVKALHVQPEFLLIDGNRFYNATKIPYACIIKGDDKFYSIAAASVLAKVSRDRFMKKKALIFPQYLWDSNKGYPTKAHRKAIFEFGATPLHRKSFNLLGDNPQEKLFM